MLSVVLQDIQIWICQLFKINYNFILFSTSDNVLKWWWRLYVTLIHWPLTWSAALCFIMMSLNLQPVDLLFFSPAVVCISISPRCPMIPSSLAVNPLPLTDGLFCCLKHLIGGQVYIIRGEFSVNVFISAGCCSFSFPFLYILLYNSNTECWWLENISTWMLNVWSFNRERIWQNPTAYLFVVHPWRRFKLRCIVLFSCFPLLWCLHAPHNPVFDTHT